MSTLENHLKNSHDNGEMLRGGAISRQSAGTSENAVVVRRAWLLKDGACQLGLNPRLKRNEHSKLTTTS